jgi:hypothetical protein
VDSIPRRGAPSSDTARNKLFAAPIIHAKCPKENNERWFVLNDSAPKPGAGFRIYLIVSAMSFLFAGLYVGWVLYSRSQANQAIEKEAAEKRRAQDQQTFEMMGGDRFDILVYAANPPIIQVGEKSSLCYSVSNAKAVKIEPQTEEPVWPAFSRCVHVSPRKTTEYTLTIEDGAGHTKSATVEVVVQ